MDDAKDDAGNWIGRYMILVDAWVYEATTGGGLSKATTSGIANFLLSPYDQHTRTTYHLI